MENKREYNLAVTLTPLEHFFFGAENRHTDETEKYYQTSMQIPQQTTIMGAMRYLILQNAGDDIFKDDKIVNPIKTIICIGAKSFNSETAAFTGFGIIRSISEVLLWKNEEKGPNNETGNCFYYPLISFGKKIKDEKSREKMKFVIPGRHKENDKVENNGSFFFGGDVNKKSTCYFDNYNAKDGNAKLWVNVKGESLHSEDIFIEQIQGGNYKNKKNKSENDDDAYFKMQFYRFNGDFSFVFNMKIADNNMVELLKGSHFINLGGERSKFLCEIEELNDKSPKKIETESYQAAYSYFFEEDEGRIAKKVILTSDTYFKDSKFDPDSIILFAGSPIKKLRFLHTKTNKNKSYNNRGSSGFTTSKLFNLIERGSIFCFKPDTDEKTIEQIFKNEAFQTIGYNQYCILDNNENI